MKRSWSKALPLFILALSLIPVTSRASTIITDDIVSISDSETIGENLYIGAGRAHIFGNALKDTTVVAGQSVLAGDFTEDVIVISGANFSDGMFREDLRIVGPNVTVSGTVNGDLLVVGGTVKIEERARLNGDVIIIAGSLIVRGEINGEAKIIAGSTELNGPINNEATITTQYLALGPRANISSTLHYFAPKVASRSETTVVSGTLEYNKISSIRENQAVERAILNFFNFWIVLKFITTLVIAFLLIYIFKYFSQQVAILSKKSFLKMFLIGILSLIIIPLVALVFAISLFALPLGIILMFLYAIVLIIGPAISGIIVGYIVWHWIRPKSGPMVSFQTATIGVVILTVLQFVPYAGELIQFIFFTVAVGVTYYYFLQKIKGSL